MLAHSKKLFSLLLCITLFGQASAMTDTITSPQSLQNRLQQTKIQQVVLNIINPACVRSYAGDLALGHNRDGFHVLKNNKIYKVDSFDVDQTIRNLTPYQLERFCENGVALSVNRVSDDTFIIRLAPNLKGGGTVGAFVGFWGGTIVVHAVSYGITYGVGAIVGAAVGAAATAATGPVAGPAAGIAAATHTRAVMANVLAVPTHVTSKWVAMACSIGLGTVTAAV